MIAGLIGRPARHPSPLAGSKSWVAWWSRTVGRRRGPAVVRLGAAFRLTVVAEGIETAEQATALRDMGCEFGQGFYFHRPLDGETAARTLREAYRGRSVAPVSRAVL
jgi:predicted signal transduction protein with EAL and GGDEF domain